MYREAAEMPKEEKLKTIEITWEGSKWRFQAVRSKRFWSGILYETPKGNFIFARANGSVAVWDTRGESRLALPSAITK